MIGLLAGLAKGMAGGKQLKLDREEKKETAALKKQLINLQIQGQKLAQTKAQTSQQIINAILASQANKGQPQQDGGSEVTPGGSFNSEVEQGKGITDKLAQADPIMQALLKQITGVDFPGASRLTETQRHNRQIEKNSASNSAERKRSNDLRETEVTWVDVQKPGGGTKRIALPKFGMGGTSIHTKQPKSSLAIDEGNLPLWVNPDTLATPPVGTTPKEAAAQGFKRLSTGQKDAIMSMGAVDKILGDVGDIMTKIFPKTESLMGRVGGATKRKVGAITQTSTEAAKFEGLIKGTLAPVIRALGEKGALSDGDVKRAINLFPLLTDDADVAWGKLEQIKSLFKQIKDQHLSVGKPDFVFNPKTGKLEPSK